MREIVVLGRRGPAQAAFTNPELRELGEMKDADVDVDPAEVELDELSREFLASDEADITTRKNVEIFTEFSQRQPEGKRRRIVLRFLRSPIEIQGDGKVERMVVARNELLPRRVAARFGLATPASARRSSAASSSARSATRGSALEGIPFDERRGVIPNEGGRVSDPESGRQVAGHYAVGWIKRGPSRRDRDEQEGRPGDGRQPARRPRGGPDPRGGRSRRGGELARASAFRSTSPTRAGRRSTAPSRSAASRSAARGSSSCRIEEMVEAARSGDPVAG